jgi:tetratricopeptide (TPR) repeat protein
MFWIYIPPIILVAALTALVIILGKKSGDLKKIKAFRFRSETSDQQNTWKTRLKSVGAKTLHLLEKILDFIKIIFKKTEQIVSGWAAKLRARRNGKKIEAILPEEIANNPDETKIIQEIEKTEQISANLSKSSEDPRQIGSGVIVRKKIIDEPIIIPKKEPLPEDKVKEAALIYRIAENPKDLEAYREIGDYYMDIGNIKDAKESFKMVLRLRPRDLKAKSSLREIEMKMRLGS